MLRKLFPDNWKIKGYTINPKDFLGQGAYGVVYRAVDSKGNKVAAKRIDIGGKHKLPNIVTDVEKLKQLNHPNIVKVFDIHQEESIVWMFMELCEFGDLNKFYSNNELSHDQHVELMTQIAAGVKYLHQHDVVHRDIKPENILVANNSPIEIKLTDFDVSKFFEEMFDTSAMSTNVGTLAFKAPEFFQRMPDGKLVYHRNVDCYAMGLTFLALLQANSKTKQLKPSIETPQDPSEKFTLSIGQLIAERIKYKIKELRVVVVGDSQSEAGTSSDAVKLTGDVKMLIGKMTYANPGDRISAAEVHYMLKKVRKLSFNKAHPYCYPLTCY